MFSLVNRHRITETVFANKLISRNRNQLYYRKLISHDPNRNCYRKKTNAHNLEADDKS